jgi:hypothetical protein
MTVPPLPELDEQLSDQQRRKLYAFLDRSHLLVIGQTFIRDMELDDAELISCALWASQYLNLDPDKLDRFFEERFGLFDITQGEYGTWLAQMLLANAENVLIERCGGPN